MGPPISAELILGDSNEGRSLDLLRPPNTFCLLKLMTARGNISSQSGCLLWRRESQLSHSAGRPDLFVGLVLVLRSMYFFFSVKLCEKCVLPLSQCLCPCLRSVSFPFCSPQVPGAPPNPIILHVSTGGPRPQAPQTWPGGILPCAQTPGAR